MKFTLFILIHFLICFNSFAQSDTHSVHVVPQASKNILFTDKLALQVNTNFQHIDYSDMQDFKEVKVLPGYFQIMVTGSKPWILLASVSYTMGRGGMNPSQDIPVSMASIMDNLTGKVIPLTSLPQPVLYSTNNLQENFYSFDLLIAPPFNVPEGNHTGIISFQLMAQ